MTEVFIDHPDEWIGIPEDIPGERWSTAYQWASDLVEELAGRFPAPQGDDVATLRDYLVAVANSRAERGASRVYASVDGWRSPVFVADMVMVSRGDAGDLTSADLAGAGDHSTIETPLATPFMTAEGVEGVKCVRYARRGLPGSGDDSEQLIARVDIVIPFAEGFVQFYTAQFDFVLFEEVLPLMDALARTVTVRD